jgi:diguanylate cyclase (GGDEF)-like protein/PAS domain S-box-containing protein
LLQLILSYRPSYIILRMGDRVARTNATGSQDEETAPWAFALVTEKSAAARPRWGTHPIRLIIICGIILIGVVTAVTAGLLSDLRDRGLAEKEHALESLALVLGEQIERSFQSIDIIQASEIERMQSLGIASAENLERQMSGYDVYQRLKDRVSSLPYLNAIILTDNQGKLINISRTWPAPSVTIPDNDPHYAYSANPRLTSLVGDPFRSPVTGNWVVPISRKFTGPNGEFLGVIIGVIELQYFEQLFQTISSGPNSTIALFRRDGTLLVRYPRQEAAIGQSFPHGAATKVLANSDHGTEREVSVIDGQERLISVRALAHYPIALVTTATVADILANWKHSTITLIGMALIIGLVVVGVVLLSVWLVGRKLREQALERDTVLSNMSQGLVMFDSAARLIVCNDRFRQMYNLPPDLIKPGCALLDLVQYRHANGAFVSNPGEYVRDLRAKIAQGAVTKHVVELDDGRITTVINHPMANGGWVATHEDVTERVRAEQLSDQRKRQLDAALENMSQGLCMFDTEQRLIVCNKRYAELYALGEEQTKSGTTLLEILEYRVAHGAAIDNPERYVSDRINQLTAAIPYKTTNRLSDGRCVSVVYRPLEKGGWVATHEDVTKAKLQEEALVRADQELLEKQFAIDQAVIFAITDVKGNITYANDHFTRISGYTREELVGQNHRILKSGIHSDRFFRDMYRQIANGQVWRGEVCNIAKDGSLYWVDSTIVPQLGPDGRPIAYMAIRINTTDRKLAEEKITYMAGHDALTGVGNRAFLHTKLEEALARVRRRQETFAVLMLDLDGFKYVNDTLGHAAGDALLKELAGRLKESLRETDILTRLGGDEFAIIQSSETNQREAATALAVRVLEIVARPFNLDGQDVTIGTSLGIALAPEDAASSEDLLKKADLALYRVKSEGRNNFRFFETEMSKDASERMQLLADIRVALTRKEFELYYQPLFDAKTQRVCSVEALVRWRHPVEGVISPDRFIPLAEETGLMEPLGEWILAQACADAASWPDEIKVAVNLSAVQFRNGKLFDIILCALVESGLPPERLELEITESVIMHNTENYVGVLQQLKNIGMAIVLDDFGTGYSSLSYLTTFPFDKIKIDKSFTQGLSNRADCAAIVASVLTLARGLDMIVTAEGVETKQQFELLRASGVHQIQGYLFARPGPVAELNFAALEQKGQAVAAA